MTPQQVLMWCDSLLKDFSLQIRAAEKTYHLEFQNGLLEIIKRKNKTGKIYFDEKNLLKQDAPRQQDDPFIEEDPAQPQPQQQVVADHHNKWYRQRHHRPGAAQDPNSDAVARSVQTEDGAVRHVSARRTQRQDLLRRRRRLEPRYLNPSIQYITIRNLYHLPKP